jgi:hypothetical protein
VRRPPVDHDIRPVPTTARRRWQATRRPAECALGHDLLGLALVRHEYLDAGPWTAGDARVTPRVPDWMRLPEEAATLPRA